MKPRISGFTAKELAEICGAVSIPLAFKVREAASKNNGNGKLTAKEQVEALQVDDELRAYARRYGQDADELIEPWRLHFRGNGYQTGKHPVADARATFMTWIRNAERFGPPKTAKKNERPKTAPMLRE